MTIVHPCVYSISTFMNYVNAVEEYLLYSPTTKRILSCNFINGAMKTNEPRYPACCDEESNSNWKTADKISR